MVKFSRILKDYQEAGSVNGLLALWGFVEDCTFLTKTGAVGLAFRLQGVDYECLDHAERHAIAQRFEHALRQLDESFRLYQYVIKRPARPIASARHPHVVVNEALQRRAAYLDAKADSLFELELYLVVLYEGWTSRRTALRASLSSVKTMTVLSEQLERAVEHLHQKADAFTVQLADTVRPTKLGKNEAFQFFRQILNYVPRKVEGVALKHDAHLDFYAADSAVECHRDHLEIDDYRVKVMTMKEPPAKTFATVLQDLYAIPSAFIACLEWQRIPNATMRRDLHSRRRHFFNKKV